MMLYNNINQDGTLVAKLPPFLWGKEVIISVTQETQAEKSNWGKISQALKKVDALDIPCRSYDDIIADCRSLRETE